LPVACLRLDRSYEAPEFDFQFIQAFRNSRQRFGCCSSQSLSISRKVASSALVSCANTKRIRIVFRRRRSVAMLDHAGLLRWWRAKGFPTARPEAGRYRCWGQTTDYFFCSVAAPVVVPWRAFRRSSRPVRRS